MRPLFLFLLLVGYGCSSFPTSPRKEWREKNSWELEEVKEEVEGSPLQKKVEGIIQKHGSQFANCYQKELEKFAQEGKTLAGEVTLGFSLDSRGRMLRAGVEESHLPIELKGCLVEVLWKVTFPAWRELALHPEVDFRLPLNFSRKNRRK